MITSGKYDLINVLLAVVPSMSRVFNDKLGLFMFAGYIFLGPFPCISP